MPNDTSMTTLWDVKVPMRDGINLSVDIYLPAKSCERSYPAILVRTPYNNTEAPHILNAKFFTANDYAYVIQDVRGRGDSEGDWYPFFNEGPDGYDTIEWVAEQSWCNKKIGMMGGSYRGWVQWAAARERPPHLITMVSTAAGGYYMKELPFVNGLPSLWMLGWLHLVGGRTTHWNVTSAVNWKKVFYHLPLKTMDEVLGRTNTVWREWMSHPNLDDFWKRVLFQKEDFEGINIPILHITGYYDGDQPGALFFYEGMVTHSSANEQQYILLGPWDHAGTRVPKQVLGGVDFSHNALIDMQQYHLKWFEYWLKGANNDVPRWKRVKYFVMGSNIWTEANGIWPPGNSEYRRYYFHSAGNANTLMGDGCLSLNDPETEQSDTYTYNPENPVIILPDFDFYGSQVEPPLDQRFILRRDDVLVYTSLSLEKELLIAGRPVVDLYASSDCFDTDWFASFANVYPDGRSISLGLGGLRARYRTSLEFPKLIEPGQVYKFTIVLDSTCVRLKPGHKLRVAITSSAFPDYARNQNTGNDIFEDTEIKTANNTIYHNKKYPSNLLLPILP